jgi:hypothetical protein
MFTKILEMLTPNVYKDRFLIIKKEDFFSYSMKAMNGLYASINIFNDIMFVDIFVKPQQFLTRYSTSLTADRLSIESSMIEHIKNNILFKVKESLVDSMIRNNYSVFRRTQITETVFSSELWIGSHFKKDYYPHILFSKKKVVKNIDRYSFKAVGLDCLETDGLGTSISQYYMVGEHLFAVSDLKSYLDLVIDNSKFGGLVSLGIDNQLSDDIPLYQKYLNTSDVLMLSRSCVSYCHIKRERRKLMIVYLDNFHDHTVKPQAYPAFIKVMKRLFRFKHNTHFYNLASVMSVTWHKGKVSTHRDSFYKEFAKKHEQDVNNMVKDGFDVLQLKYPSKSILDTLSELGLPNSLPLSRESLTVLEMYDI